MAILHLSEDDTSDKRPPGQYCGTWGKVGEHILDYPEAGEVSVMVMDLVSDVVDDDAICSDADAGAFISRDLTRADTKNHRRVCGFR